MTKIILLCMMALLVSIQAANEEANLRGSSTFPGCDSAERVKITTNLGGDRVMIQIPNQANTDTGIGTKTINSLCSGGECHDVTTMVAENPQPSVFCYSRQWPLLRIQVTPTSPSSTAGFFNVDPNHDFGVPWESGMHILISGDAWGPAGHTGCQSFASITPESAPLYICPGTSED